MKKKFGVVLILNFNNWLLDLELAFKNVADATRNQLYLLDGFITDNQSAEQIAPVDEEGLLYMYNLKYITAFLEKNGFRVETVKSLNYQKIHINDFHTVPGIKIPAGTKIYILPNETSDFVLSTEIEARSNYDLKGFYHITSLGWVLKSDVKAKFNQPSLFVKLARNLSLLNFYYYVQKIRHERQYKTKACMIKAVKVQWA